MSQFEFSISAVRLSQRAAGAFRRPKEYVALFSITTGFQSAETVIGERTGFAFRLQLDPLPRRDCENQCLKGSISTELGRPRHVRFTPYSNRIADIPDWQLRAMAQERTLRPKRTPPVHDPKLSLASLGASH